MLPIIYTWFIKKEVFFPLCCSYASFNCDLNNIKHIDFTIDSCNITFHVFNFTYTVCLDSIVVLFTDEASSVCRSEYGMVNFPLNMPHTHVHTTHLLVYSRHAPNKCCDVQVQELQFSYQFSLKIMTDAVCKQLDGANIPS